MRTASIASADFCEFYRCIVEEEGRTSVAPMLKFARRLRQCPYASNIAGETSLEHMVLSSHEGDSIVIGYFANEDVFAVTYRDSRNRRHIKYEATTDQIDTLIDGLINRLMSSQQ